MKRPFPFPATSGLEPKISEMLEDQTMLLVLARDGLKVSDVEAMIERWRATHLSAFAPPTPA